jgi:hypothetical protein
MPFVVLDGSLVFLRRGPGRKRASIAAMASLLLAGVQPIFARRELADHGASAGSVSTKQSILWGKVPLSLHRFETGDCSPQDETQRSSGDHWHSCAWLPNGCASTFFGGQAFNCPGFVGLSLGSTIASTSAVPGDSSAPLIAGTTSSGRSQR